MSTPVPVPLATVADVQARTDQELTPGEQARAAVFIADATALARSRVIPFPSPPPDTAVGVICTAVLRALGTPADGVKSETVGGHTRVAAREGGGLYLTDDELDLLRPAAPGRGDAFSIWTT
ncbi:hypothetical protein JOD54_001935 [Actinokineospora baliensis]|uniref:hypothetical protein n=1 Tax=Actinokineospora baliensis TaxID=547056 RepID=UPI0019594404|nr:hypothetical protein [Actinokineospora baliensis]MBM7771731.1 hypothetical protein [Actinokineospora baliensis]